MIDFQYQNRFKSCMEISSEQFIINFRAVLKNILMRLGKVQKEYFVVTWSRTSREYILPQDYLNYWFTLKLIFLNKVKDFLQRLVFYSIYNYIFVLKMKVYFQTHHFSAGSKATVTSTPGLISFPDNKQYYQNGLDKNIRIMAPMGSR